jgi:hypothetical protein
MRRDLGGDAAGLSFAKQGTRGLLIGGGLRALRTQREYPQALVALFGTFAKQGPARNRSVMGYLLSALFTSEHWRR